MTVREILPLMNKLPHAEKLQLMQVLLCQISMEEGIELNSERFTKPASAFPHADKVRIQDLVPRQVNAFTPLSRDAIYER
ncbi:MAG: hypothetical protein GY862_24940 [Gammaproteobacteria bacterium]|nr:hypothetical protein [Gammaproteobacteria bacterium]